MTRINQSRSAWLMLALSALGLVLAALYFQYYLQLEPCVLCVYERSSVAMIFFAGLVGFINPNMLWLRLSGYLLWAGGVIWGLYLSIRHAGIQMGLIQDSSCEFVANFPSWMQLDHWLPWLFNPTGYCDEIQWQFLGLSMPQTMVIANVVYLIVMLVVLVAEFRRPRGLF
ncbi:MAG: disulfide bond formation protein DsbB [Gammaproteobacteria bacterium]|nr:disulfide bond formation protein DsbB [Gammaproteobacteria bacterium]